MASPTQFLVIDRGDLPSLAATLLDPDLDRLILWHVLETDEGAKRRLMACEAKAKALGVKKLIVTNPIPLGLKDLTPPPELYQAMLLIQASTLARQLNCKKIVWPRQVGPDFERMAEIVDRASQISEMATNLDSGEGVFIDLPLIDLNDEHLVDMIEESAGPLELFWPCEKGDGTPCGVCKSCIRWQEAFEAKGVPWPWAKAILER